MTNKVIGALIMVVIGLALLPIVSDFKTELTQAAVTDTNGTVLTPAGDFYNTTTGSLLDILPILFVIILVVGLVAFIKISK